jgi:hypothetical protein
MYDASLVDYYRGRERAERELADQAASIAVRNIHLDLADRYREMAQRGQIKQPRQDRDRLPSDDASTSDGDQAQA